MSCEIVVRRARASDEVARADIVRSGFNSHQREAFLLFFFQELTLQCLVLGGATLFIFVGVSALGCTALLPALALVAAVAVRLAHHAAAEKQVQSIRKELYGLVAEYRGPLASEPRLLAPAVVVDIELQRAPEKAVYSQIVGTVSVSEFWGPQQSGWLHALAAHPQWRRRGVGRALVAAAAAAAARAGLRSLECAASQLQPAARALLHERGWEVRGWYHRRLCGAALTLLLAQLGTDLPPPPPPSPPPPPHA